MDKGKKEGGLLSRRLTREEAIKASAILFVCTIVASGLLAWGLKSLLSSLSGWL